MKILLADDDRDQLELRSMLLARGGFETIQACDGRTALEAAAAQMPECAVVDLRLPTEELGLGLIRGLKNLNAAMRVIVLTGGDPSRLNELPERRLVDEVIVKGTSSANLLEALRALAGPPKLNLDELQRRLLQNGSIVIDVRVSPRASASEITEIRSDGSLKVRLNAIPDKGKANAELVTLLANRFEVAKSRVQILSGETSSRKRVRISR